MAAERLDRDEAAGDSLVTMAKAARPVISISPWRLRAISISQLHSAKAIRRGRIDQASVEVQNKQTSKHANSQARRGLPSCQAEEGEGKG